MGIGDPPKSAPIAGDARCAHWAAPRRACAPPQSEASWSRWLGLGGASEVTRAPPAVSMRPQRVAEEALRIRTSSLSWNPWPSSTRSCPSAVRRCRRAWHLSPCSAAPRSPSPRRFAARPPKGHASSAPDPNPVDQPDRRFLPSDGNYSGGRIRHLPHCGLMDHASLRWIERLLIPIVMHLVRPIRLQKEEGRRNLGTR